LPDKSGEFDTFYDLYPKKVNKKAAKARWVTAIKVTDPAVILAGIQGAASTDEDHRGTLHPGA